MGVKIWNCLPLSVRNLSKSTFKKKCNPAGKATSKQRRNDVRGCRRIDVEKGLKTQTESTLRNRRSFNVWKSTLFQCLEIDVVSTSGNRRRFNVEKSTSFQRL